MSRSLKLFAVLAFATLALAACGKRGVLEPPGSEDNSLAADIPARGKGGKSAAYDPADGPSEAKPKTKEEAHKPFVLDGLLR
jgi:predicted small lipoprotein YifL